jgi:hypothetical protein
VDKDSVGQSSRESRLRYSKAAGENIANTRLLIVQQIPTAIRNDTESLIDEGSTQSMIRCRSVTNFGVKVSDRLQGLRESTRQKDTITDPKDKNT